MVQFYDSCRSPMKPKRQLVPPVTWIVAGVAILILAAILLIPVSEVRNGPGSRRTIDASNLRQIGQAALIYAMDHDGRLPETNLGADGIPSDGETTTVHRYAVALAREAGLNDISLFISASDKHPGVRRDWHERFDVRIIQSDSPSGLQSRERLSYPEDAPINPDFLESGISFQLVGGLTEDLPYTTPIAFTRGLREDGRWDRDNAVYGSDGGHIVFLGGNVMWRRNVSFDDTRLTSLSGEPTANVLETLSPDHAVYGDPDPPIADGTRGVGAIAESPAE